MATQEEQVRQAIKDGFRGKEAISRATGLTQKKVNEAVGRLHRKGKL